MKKALVSPTEEVPYAYQVYAQRIAEVMDEEYPVCLPCHWVDCEDDVTPETHCFKDGNVVIWPQPVMDEETGVFTDPYGPPSE